MTVSPMRGRARGEARRTRDRARCLLESLAELAHDERSGRDEALLAQTVMSTLPASALHGRAMVVTGARAPAGTADGQAQRAESDGRRRSISPRWAAPSR